MTTTGPPGQPGRTDLRATVEALVAQDRLDQAVIALAEAVRDADPEAGKELVELRSTLARAAKNQRRGLLEPSEWERARRSAAYQILELLDQVAEAGEGAASGDVATPSGSHRIFLSYNHDDKDEVAELTAALQACGIQVHIDREAMAAGEGIRAFIERSIRETSATVCVVSKQSLLSAWVAIETIEAFHAERMAGSRRFIACYLDDDFFEPTFRLECTERIDRKIAEIDELIPKYVEKRLDTADLNTTKTRLYGLRNNLGDILLRLRDSLTLNLRGEGAAATARRIAATLAGE